VHQQGPLPQQVEAERIGHVVAAVGDAMPAVAFSSLMASRGFLQTETAKTFTRAYRRARSWVTGSRAEEIADREAALFPGIAREALSKSITRYQALGCWDGDIVIPRELYEQALDVFTHGGAISARHAYEEVVVPPP
jgi:NitT/TauT family transport system substrate-binding protein